MTTTSDRVSVQFIPSLSHRLGDLGQLAQWQRDYHLVAHVRQRAHDALEALRVAMCATAGGQGGELSRSVGASAEDENDKDEDDQDQDEIKRNALRM